MQATRVDIACVATEKSKDEKKKSLQEGGTATATTNSKRLSKKEARQQRRMRAHSKMLDAQIEATNEL